MPKFNDLSRSLVAFEQDSTLVAVIEMGSESWLVGGLVPGLSRDPRMKLATEPLKLLSFTGGVTRRLRRGTRSSGSALPMRPVGTASGWRAGCASGGLTPM
jgi:hypothetical protein